MLFFMQPMAKITCAIPLFTYRTAILEANGDGITSALRVQFEDEC
jgi:hypothetical protein